MSKRALKPDVKVAAKGRVKAGGKKKQAGAEAEVCWNLRLRLVVLFSFLVYLLGAGALRAQEGPCTNDPKDNDPKAYKLWTGPKGEYYAQLGWALTIAAGHAGPKGVKIACRTSNGSVANIDALESGKADFALVQSDVAHLAWYAEPPFNKRARIKLIAPLFAEKVQILVRPHLYVTSPVGLRRPKSVWMGAEKSGSRLSALMVLQASGKTKAEAESLEFTDADLTFEEAKKRLRSGELDAVFRTSVAPNREVAETLADKNLEIRLLGLDVSAMDVLVKNGMYIETSLQRMDYRELPTGLFTVGVEALLVVREGVDGDDIATVADLLQDNPIYLERRLGLVLASAYDPSIDPNVDSRVPPQVAAKVIAPSSQTLLGTKLPEPLMGFVDANAAEFLWRWPIRREAAIRILVLVVLLAACTGLLLHPWGRRRAGRFVRLIAWVMALAFSWMIGAAWLQAVEGELNQNFTTLGSASWAMAQNLVGKLLSPLQISISAPTPTTRQGTSILNWFTGIFVLLVTTFAYPWLKKLWQRLHGEKGGGAVGGAPSVPKV